MYQTYKFPGTFDKTVTIDTDIAEQPEIIVHLQGKVDPIPMGVLEVEPRKIMLGDLAAGRETTFAIPLRNAGNADMRITRVLAKKSGTVLFQGELKIAPGQAVELPVSLTPGSGQRLIEYLLIQGEARNIVRSGYKVVVIGSIKQ